MTRPRFLGGSLLAALAAGPAVTLAIFVQFAFATGQIGDYFGALMVILLIAAPIGFIVALLPTIGASAVLARIGVWHRPLRHWLVWAAASLGMGMSIGLLLIAASAHAGSPHGWQGVWLFGVAGVPCALLARWRTRWLD